MEIKKPTTLLSGELIFNKGGITWLILENVANHGKLKFLGMT